MSGVLCLSISLLAFLIPHVVISGNKFLLAEQYKLNLNQVERFLVFMFDILGVYYLILQELFHLQQSHYSTDATRQCGLASKPTPLLKFQPLVSDFGKAKIQPSIYHPLGLVGFIVGLYVSKTLLETSVASQVIVALVGWNVQAVDLQGEQLQLSSRSMVIMEGITLTLAWLMAITCRS